MTTTTPPQSTPEDAERIVGDRLEAELVEAGLAPAAGRAIQHALQLLVLRLLLVLPTKTEVRMIVNDSGDSLRREFQARFELLERQMRWQFYVLFSLILLVLAAVLGSYFV